MSTALEHFYKVTATNAWDLAHEGMRPNRVTVGVCPVDIQGYKPRLASVESASTEQDEYIEKVTKFIREQLQELDQYIDIPIGKIIDVVVDSIKSGWKDMVDKGHTIGGIIEVTGIVGFGAVGGIIIAGDITGVSFLGFAGMAAGAAAEISGLIGGLYYPNSRESLEGFGGEFNASIAFYGGVEWEAMFTGGDTGHVLGVTGGFGAALSVEFQHAWLIAEKVL